MLSKKIYPNSVLLLSGFIFASMSNSSIVFMLGQSVVSCAVVSLPNGNNAKVAFPKQTQNPNDWRKHSWRARVEWRWLLCCIRKMHRKKHHSALSIGQEARWSGKSQSLRRDDLCVCVSRTHRQNDRPSKHIFAHTQQQQLTHNSNPCGNILIRHFSWISNFA